MSFVFRGTRGDIESGFPGFIPERRAMVCFFYFSCWTEFSIAAKAWMFLPYFFSFSSESSISMFDIGYSLQQRVHTARPVNSNSLAFLVTGTLSQFSLSFLRKCLFCQRIWDLYKCIFFFSSGYVAVLLLFMILNSHQMSPNFLVCSFCNGILVFISAQVCAFHFFSVSNSMCPLVISYGWCLVSS